MPLLDTFPGEKLLIRIAEIAQQGGIGLLRPFQMRREGRAQTDVEVERRLAIARAELEIEQLKLRRATLDRDFHQPLLMEGATTTFASPPWESQRAVEAIASTFSSDSMVPPTTKGRYGEDVLLRVAEKELRRAINLEHILNRAQEEARDTTDERASDDAIDADWLARWRGSAEDVSYEQLQTLWARILTNEVRQPGTYSLRTLDFLRSVSRSEAQLVAKIAPFVIGRFVHRNLPFLERKGVSLAELLELEALGVLTAVQGAMNAKIEPTAEEMDGLPCCELILAVSNLGRGFELECFHVTSLGSEIFGLCRASADIENLRQIAELYVRQGATCRIGKYVGRIGNTATMELPPLEILEPPGHLTPVKRWLTRF